MENLILGGREELFLNWKMEDLIIYFVVITRGVAVCFVAFLKGSRGKVSILGCLWVVRCGLLLLLLDVKSVIVVRFQVLIALSTFQHVWCYIPEDNHLHYQSVDAAH